MCRIHQRKTWKSRKYILGSLGWRTAPERGKPQVHTPLYLRWVVSGDLTEGTGGVVLQPAIQPACLSCCLASSSFPLVAGGRTTSLSSRCTPCGIARGAPSCGSPRRSTKATFNWRHVRPPPRDPDLDAVSVCSKCIRSHLRACKLKLNCHFTHACACYSSIFCALKKY